MKEGKLNSIRDVLNFLMSECDVDDAELSRQTGIPASTISRLKLNAEANPTASTLKPLAKFFSISIDQLLGEEPLDHNRLPGTCHLSFRTDRKIPVLDWENIFNWIEGKNSAFQGKFMQWLSTEKEVGDRSFALQVSTDSLGIMFRKGTIVMLDPDQSPCDGDLILIKKSKETAYLKQMIIEGNNIYTKSLNKEIKGITALESDEKIIAVLFETRFSLRDESLKIRENKKMSLLKNFIMPKAKKI